MIPLFGVDIPHRQPGAVEGRQGGQRRVEVLDSGGACLGQQTFDVVLQHRERRVPALPLHPHSGRHDLKSDPFEGREHVDHRSSLDNVATDSPRLECDGARAHDQRIALDLQGAHDNLGCTDELAHPNDGGCGQGRGGRDLQTVECPLALFARNHWHTQRAELVRQQDSRPFTEPEDGRLAFGVLEGHDEHSGRRWGCARATRPVVHSHGDQRTGKTCAETGTAHVDTTCESGAFNTATMSVQVAAPMPRHGDRTAARAW